MPKLKWLDTSSWSQSDKDRASTKEWTLKTPYLSIVIHHYIGMGEEWMVTCYDVRLERRALDTADANEAKKRAIKMVRDKLQQMTNAITEE